MNIIDINAITRDYPALKRPDPQDSHKGTSGTLRDHRRGCRNDRCDYSGRMRRTETGCGKSDPGFNQPQLPVPFVENAPELMLRTACALADDSR